MTDYGVMTFDHPLKFLNGENYKFDIVIWAQIISTGLVSV